jgi:hypothetical protein
MIALFTTVSDEPGPGHARPARSQGPSRGRGLLVSSFDRAVLGGRFRRSVEPRAPCSRSSGSRTRKAMTKGARREAVRGCECSDGEEIQSEAFAAVDRYYGYRPREPLVNRQSLFQLFDAFCKERGPALVQTAMP